MKIIITISLMLSSIIYAISPEEFPFKQEFTVNKTEVNAFYLDHHVIETLNNGLNNLIIINPNREIVSYKIIKQNIHKEYTLKRIPEPAGVTETNSQRFYFQSPKLYFKNIQLSKAGTIKQNTKININGYMQNIKDKRAVARTMTRVESTEAKLTIPLFKETYYPYYEIEIKTSQNIKIESVIGQYKAYLMLVKSIPGKHTLYYGSNEQYPVNKIHNLSLNLSQKPSMISSEKWTENDSYNNPNKLRNALSYPKLILLITIIIGLIIALQWIKKRNAK